MDGPLVCLRLYLHHLISSTPMRDWEQWMKLLNFVLPKVALELYLVMMMMVPRQMVGEINNITLSPRIPKMAQKKQCYQFGCGTSRMVGPKKQDFCNVVTRFQGFHLIFWNGGARGLRSSQKWSSKLWSFENLESK